MGDDCKSGMAAGAARPSLGTYRHSAEIRPSLLAGLRDSPIFFIRHPKLVPGSTVPQKSRAGEFAERWMPERVRHDGKGTGGLSMPYAEWEGNVERRLISGHRNGAH